MTTSGELIDPDEPDPTELTVGNSDAERSIAIAERQFELAKQQYELVERRAANYASSSLVPEAYRGERNKGSVMIAMTLAKRVGLDPLTVMQNLHVIQGRPVWSSQFLIACFNASGRFSAIKYRFTEDGTACTAVTTELKTGELIEGTTITMHMAELEGWLTKKGSKWQTMPQQMLRYRAAVFLIRAVAPEISLGLFTADEINDIGKN